MTIRELIAWLRGKNPDPILRQSEPLPPAPEIFVWKGRKYIIGKTGALVDPVLRKERNLEAAAYDAQLVQVNLERMRHGQEPLNKLPEERPVEKRYTNI